jgi:hypothetical protein
MSYLSISSISVEMDASGQPYKKIGFSPLDFLPSGKEIIATGRERFRNVWDDATRSVNGVDTLIKGDLLFHTAEIGGAVIGEISTFSTKGTYNIPGSTAALNTVTVVTFKGESPAVRAANQAGVPVFDHDGEVVRPTSKNSNVPVTLPVEP